MKIWITKYLFTSGIECIHAEENCGRFFSPIYGNLREGSNCYRNESEAVARANKMRELKIASLKKQILKLESLEFKVLDGE